MALYYDMNSPQHDMVSCKHGKVGSSWRQKIVLDLLSTFPCSEEPVLLRTDVPWASRTSPSIRAVCQNKETFLDWSKKTRSTLQGSPLSFLFSSDLSPSASHFCCKSSHPCLGPGIPLLGRKVSFLYRH